MDGGFGNSMDSPWLIAYLVLLGLAVAQSVLLVLQTWEHRRYARSCMRRLDRHRPTGRAAVFAPCKGWDIDLEENLRALLRQDYHDYEVTFLVESVDDPAVEVIRRAMADHRRVAARLVIAGQATACGQKVHNLRSGTAGLSPQIEYLAFLDSDARPRPEWLRLLIARLCEANTGAVTGYRWFVPVRDSLANHLLYSMNCDIMSLLGRSSHYLVWGGSWGIRRAVFESIDLRSRWAGTLSDDLAAARQLRRARLRVRFEPGCVVASPLDYSLSEMFCFVRRQYLMARFYVVDWWAFALAASTVTSLAWLGSLAVLGWSLVHGTPPAWIPACGAAVLYLLGVSRGSLRQDLVGTYFPDRQEELRRAGRFDVWASPLARLAHWLGILGSLLGQHMTWRGISYRVLPGGQARVAGRDGRLARGPADGCVAALPARDEEHRQEPETATRKLVPYRKAC
jgi:cellulose synthase/poly-beta-1,6-N-acetylglucosamine synthase-like glycosyltransferase